ncbi:acyltransferase family protein [Jeotgalicoccus psychrophilus]|uniref:acyltransferase family protein n=2 Tax=Jeotgalicoccus TaxID=227979 RepID=UPI000409A3C5|nr:acyltransferase [Jeotgalicoccus psychrophilus]
MAEKKRFTEIDALRGIAAIVVVLYHYIILYDEKFGHSKENYIEIFSYGHYGVQLFFIISGFVIYMSVLKVKSTSDFLTKRAIRLYPTYIFAIIVTTLVVGLSSVDTLKAGVADTFINMTMFQDFFGAKNVDGVYWSLRVELTFYLLMALLLIFNLQKRVMLFTSIWLGSSALIQITNGIAGTETTALLEKFSMSNYCQMFIIGIMFYYIWQHGNYLKYYLMITLSLIYDFSFEGMTNGLFTIFFIAVFYLILNNKMQWLKSDTLVYLGTLSFPLYLIHQNIGYVIIQKLESMGFVHEVFLIVPLGLSLILAHIILYYVEKPSHNVLFKLYKERQLAMPNI